ncbi:heat stress transcription factor B-2c-like isoform X2 [Phragmites australis]|uniref:heat stress transcription factor B-2c-like isoform X2 n=1 Tax=Phragmites australis TaxID=29695 RepID=UPI002D79CAF9|nr:heat stress transcription factor B-2c-like isoform X2 [Phragmites australis]
MGRVFFSRAGLPLNYKKFLIRNRSFQKASSSVPSTQREAAFPHLETSVSPTQIRPGGGGQMAEQIGAAAAEAAASEPPAPAPVPAPAQRSLLTPFLTKTYQLVDDMAVDDVISWNDDGSTFVVWRPAEFARDLLPKYFKHNNFSSFVRQLNTYGFRKIVPDRWEFANDCFRRGEKRLLCDIHRRKVAPAPAAPAQGLATAAAAAAASGVVTVAAAPIPMALPVTRPGSPALSSDEQVLSSNSGSAEEHQLAPSGSGGSGSRSASGDMGEENERLRRENARLTRELGQMKKLCNNILLLMSKYATSQQLDSSAALSSVVNCSGESSEAVPPLPPLPPAILELMPSCPALATAAAGLAADAGPDAAARLFGISIGLKRSRDGDGEDSADHGAGAEVKPETSDPHSGSKEQSPDQHPWPIYRPTPVYHSTRPCIGPDPGAGSDQDGSNSSWGFGNSSLLLL